MKRPCRRGRVRGTRAPGDGAVAGGRLWDRGNGFAIGSGVLTISAHNLLSEKEFSALDPASGVASASFRGGAHRVAGGRLRAVPYPCFLAIVQGTVPHS